MALAIEAYGVEGAIALFDRYPVQFVDALISQTSFLRSDPEDIAIDEKYDRLEDLLEKEPDKEMIFTNPSGESKNIKLSNFFLDF